MSYKGFTSAGAAKGYEGATTKVADFASPQAVASRAQARVLKEQADQKLAQVKATRATEGDLENLSAAQSAELETLKNENQRMAAESARQRVYSSFEKYSVDGDLRHINNGLQDLAQNPVGARLFPNVVRVEKLTEEDADLLKQLGITYEQYKSEPAVQKAFFKSINKDGTKSLIPLQGLHVGTKYHKYQRQEELDEALQAAKIHQMLRANTNASSSRTERLAHTLTEQQMPEGMPEKNWVPGNAEYDAAYLKNITKAATMASPVKEENLTEREAEARRAALLARPDEVSTDDWDTGNSQFDAKYQEIYQGLVSRDRETKSQKEIVAADAALNKMEEKAQTMGHESFLDIDFKDRKNFVAFAKPMQDYMRLNQIKFSDNEKNTFYSIHELIDLGDISKELTSRETGLIDRMVIGVKKYLSNDVEGLDTASAYSAFRNVVRHSLYGSVLTKGELASFHEQFGSLKQQTGPILEQFKIGLGQVKSQLESLMQFQDPYVAHFYLGQSDRELYDVLAALDENIDNFTKIEKLTAKEEPVINLDQPKSLDSIYEEVYSNDN